MNPMRQYELASAILIIGPDLTILRLACPGQTFLGYYPEELEGRNLTKDALVVNDQIPLLIRDFSRALKEGLLLTESYEFITKDRLKREVALICAPLKLKKEGQCFVLMCSDSSVLVRDQIALRPELIQADKMISLGVLVSGIAHEINNPNNFIMLNAPILKAAWQDALPILDKYYMRNGDFMIGGLSYSEFREEVHHLLTGIEEGSRRIKQIVSDLRDYVRLGQGHKTEVDLNKVVTKAITLLDNMIKKSTNTFRVNLAPNMPKIRANPQHIEQVVINLIQNACQALTRRDQSVQVSTMYDQNNEDVVIEVADQGQGMEPEILDKIMIPFFTTKGSSDGTGLGLAVSKNIAVEHGGEIQVKSEKGKGSIFRLVLPKDGRKRKQRILIADDDEGFRTTMTQALESQGVYEVESVSNGVEACIKIGESLPDLLVLDIMMPGMDGIEVCEVINRRIDLHPLKVLIVTGLQSSEKIEELKQMGFSRILIKPFKRDTFLNEVKALLQETSQRPC